MWNDLDRMISNAIDPVISEAFDYRPMVEGSISGPQQDMKRPAVPDLLGILDFEGAVGSFKAGNGREAKFHLQVAARRAELSVDRRQFEGGEPQAGDVLRQDNDRVWQVLSVWLDATRYEMLLKRVT
jgi:hypothetical protein